MIFLDSLRRELHSPEREKPLVSSTTSREPSPVFSDLKMKAAITLYCWSFAVREEFHRELSISHDDALDELIGRNLTIYSRTLRPGIRLRVLSGECAESVEGSL
tara:strand:- start:269 stop:580 length:312 start_codon:yes stop_codon:yes gene_type:complete